MFSAVVELQCAAKRSIALVRKKKISTKKYQLSFSTIGKYKHYKSE